MRATLRRPVAFSHGSVAAGPRLFLRLDAIVAVALCAAMFAPQAHAMDDPANAAKTSTTQRAPIDRATAERIQALNPERITDREVRDVLAHAPAPRIILLQGSLAPVTMQPFAEFLIAMGYPEERIRNPDGTFSTSSFGSSATLAGTLAWYYERDGMMPMLIGHSQGGMLVIRTLHELAGAFADTIPVWDPTLDAAQSRSTITDPYSGAQRPVIGLKVSYASAIATGKLPRVLLGQWSILPLLRKIPDTVADFTGFFIEWDAIAGTFPWSEPYQATGSASVRNVTLPASYVHIDLPRTQHLAANEATRAWINGYTPGTDLATAPSAAGVDMTNLLHAADIWYSVKKHWCLEAQHLLRAGQNK
jgi:hypothetical protein